jgi:hypothetical protein
MRILHLTCLLTQETNATNKNVSKINLRVYDFTFFAVGYIKGNKYYNQPRCVKINISKFRNLYMHRLRNINSMKQVCCSVTPVVRVPQFDTRLSCVCCFYGYMAALAQGSPDSSSFLNV